MLGHKASEFRQHQSISLEDLVPDDNFYRQVERTLDLRFVRELVAELYSNIGRASIDPVVFSSSSSSLFLKGSARNDN